MKITITVYEIKPIMTEGVVDLKLPKTLYDTLNQTNTTKERLMPLSDDENNKDLDFISNFSSTGGFLFGSFVRLNKDEESIVLLPQLDKKTIGINEMVSEASNNSAGSISASSFFCMSEDILVLNNARTTRRSLETYINWFLREHKTSVSQVKFIPKMNTAKGIPLKDIRSIQIAENFIMPDGSPRSETINFRNIKEKTLKLFFSDVKGIKDYEWEDVISATLTLKVNKKELRKDNAAALNSTLRVVNSDDVIITGKDNRRIKGTEYLMKAVKDIEQTGSGYYNEQAIETEMRSIIKAAKNGEMVN